MTVLRRILRYELRLSISVGVVLEIVAAVVVINAIWPRSSNWIGFPVGVGIVLVNRLGADIWRSFHRPQRA